MRPFWGIRAPLLLLPLCVVVLAAGETAYDTCECQCCNEVEAGRIECVSAAQTTFQAPTCSHCGVLSCIKQFPEHCGAKGASIVADCVERTAWYLRIIPIVFVASTIALLFYGFFIKTFDGYNPVPGRSGDRAALAPRGSFSPAPYGAVTPFDPRASYAVRRPSPLSQAAPLSRPAAFGAAAATTQPQRYGGVIGADNSTDPLPSIQLPLTHAGLQAPAPAPAVALPKSLPRHVPPLMPQPLIGVSKQQAPPVAEPMKVSEKTGGNGAATGSVTTAAPADDGSITEGVDAAPKTAEEKHPLSTAPDSLNNGTAPVKADEASRVPAADSATASDTTIPAESSESPGEASSSVPKDEAA